MTKKRRMFDIDLPEGEVETPAPVEPQRRGPMATAITETGEASRQRAEVEAAIRVERMPLAAGEVKCTAAAGKIELQLDRDFSTVERGRLEAAIESFFRKLG